ncbi:hypothetical protein ACH5RR_025375 [Cinchona calisaya]|uniref:Uncharacterized protein n=1 Tax=Cinchona calisaya TaxID=153742 RepID=A0ABD2Z4H0_9GENT
MNDALIRDFTPKELRTLSYEMDHNLVIYVLNVESDKAILFSHIFSLFVWRLFHCLLQEAQVCGKLSGVQEVKTIKSILDPYGVASGQEINLKKSAIVFNKNTDLESKDCISRSSFFFTWKGISEVQEFVTLGSRWRVGNGCSIKIWADRWLPCSSSFQIVSRLDKIPTNSTVDCLIDKTRNTWNHGLLEELFWQDECDLSRSIPLGDPRNQDKLVRHYTKNGMFAVRSAYHIIRSQSTSIKQSVSSSNGHEYKSRNRL